MTPEELNNALRRSSVQGRRRSGSQHAGFFLVHDGRTAAGASRKTANKLMEVSAKAQERARLHDEGCALITAQNASAREAVRQGIETSWANIRRIC